ncbi:class I SAM-dependent methyltransferase [Nocardiopsis synnemataformans]|uniref:class I SAM-dependent methyltransferase n=1 Tax=Nocardiopsis synnemataformans TaxID=61305 RepID=UPI003EBDD7C8
MTHDGQDLTSPSTEFWEPLHQSAEPVTAPPPNARLTELVRDLELAPGHACDLGSGRGGDARWLASLGWHVTATEVSATAVARIADMAAAQGLDRLRAERHDLSRTLPTGPFGLVYACYFHSPVAFGREEVLRRAAQHVAVGGRLVIIDHASTAPWSWRFEDEEPAFPTPEETLGTLMLADGWITERCESAERVANGPDGTTARVTDNVIVVRRRHT